MEMFSYSFMIRAVIAALCIAIIAPLLGVFLIVRRQSLLSDTLSHVSLSGVAIGLFLGINPTITTLILVIIASIFLEWLRTIYSSYSEVSTAILMSSGLAIALVLMGLSNESVLQINQYLFGSIVTISPVQVALLLMLVGIILLLFILFKKPMYILTFDESVAHVDGLPTKMMSLLFNIVTGVAITIMIPIAGALLVSAIMVIPAAISMRIGKKFTYVFLYGIAIGVIGMLVGLVTSYQLDVSPGAMITLVYIIIFFAVVLIQRMVKN